MREPEVVVSENIFPDPVVCDRFRREFAWRLLVLLSQDLPSPFVIVRFARMLVPKRNSVYMVHH